MIGWLHCAMLAISIPGARRKEQPSWIKPPWPQGKWSVLLKLSWQKGRQSKETLLPFPLAIEL